MRFELFGFRFEFGKVADSRKRRILPIPKVVAKCQEEASDLFWDAFQFGGTLCCTCRCGRTHFCSNTTLDFEDGELLELLRKANVDPRYIENTIDDSVAVIDGPNGLIVWGCPCHSAKPFEVFLVDYQSCILAYFRKRLAMKNDEAGELASALATAERGVGA